MTLEELKTKVDLLCDKRHKNSDVVVTLDNASAGCRAFARVVSIVHGFDWEAEQVRIGVDRRVIEMDCEVKPDYGKDRRNEQ